MFVGDYEDIDIINKTNYKCQSFTSECVFYGYNNFKVMKSDKHVTK